MADLPCDSGGFNVTFNDEDEKMLLEYAARPVEQRPYTCGWVTSGMTCNVPIIGASFSMHLRDQHGVEGESTKAKVRCNWTKCGTVVNKENLVRHVTEQHLLYRFLCEECGGNFSRRHTLNSHVQKKH